MSELNGNFNGVNSSNRVHDWETGLPNVDDITPLSYGLLSPELLSAFNIKPEPYRTSGDVTQASEKTLSSLRATATAAVEDDGDVVSPEDAEEEGEEKAAKKARLVWTPQLHRRFVEVVARLGIKNAVPKTIMQLMNVEGLSRENVASHLQKYRLYLKRNQGFGFDSSPSGGSVPAQAPVQVQVPVQSNNHFNYNNNNGVMQTGNNMYGSIGVSYRQNHLNHHHNMQK